MKIAICDDDAIFVKSLNEQLLALREANDTAIELYTDVDALIFSIGEGKVFDVIFMDIRFSKKPKNGIDYASQICKTLPGAQIIFVTAFNEKYSQEIFLKRVNLCGYLVKPVRKDILTVLLNKAREEIKLQAEECLFAENKTGIQRIPFRHIAYLESVGHKVIVHHNDEQFTMYKKLGDIVSTLPSYFLHCHKSYVINMDEISRIGDKEILLRSQVKVPISRARRAATIDKIMNYNKRA